MFRKILIHVQLLDLFSSSSSFFFFLLCLSSFLPLPGLLTMTTEMERCREAGGEGEREGRRERVPPSTVNDIIGTQPLLCLFSLNLALCFSVQTCFFDEIHHVLFNLINHSNYFFYYIFCDTAINYSFHSPQQLLLSSFSPLYNTKHNSQLSAMLVLF